MTTTATPATDVATQQAVPRTTGADFVTAALQSAKRTILQFFRTPQLLLLGTIQGALFLFMFRYIFGGAINPGNGLELRRLPRPRVPRHRDPLAGDAGRDGRRGGRRHRRARPDAIVADPAVLGDRRDAPWPTLH